MVFVICVSVICTGLSQFSTASLYLPDDSTIAYLDRTNSAENIFPDLSTTVLPIVDSQKQENERQEQDNDNVVAVSTIVEIIPGIEERFFPKQLS